MRAARRMWACWMAVCLVLAAACTPIVVPVSTPETTAPTATLEAGTVPPGLPGVVASRGDIEILSSEMPVQEAQVLYAEAVIERKKMEAFWGRTWPHFIRIHSSSSFSTTNAFTHAFDEHRGYMEMPAQLQTTAPGGRPSALLSQIVYIYAPNDNRLLMDGLAIYAQERLGGYLTADLHFLASSQLGELSALGLVNLNAVRTPTPLWVTLRGNQRAAYAFAGSFVRFLIEKYGLDAFRVVYDTEDYERAYGKPLTELDQEWRQVVIHALGGS